MPYPIPDNLDNIEGWRWYLVPLPDNDQMIQVAWGMWSELTHFWNWGKEGPVPEQSEKAAQLWAAALYEAWRIRDMGFPDLILTYIDEVETLLEAIRDRPCCPPALETLYPVPDGSVDVTDVGDQTGQDIVWDVGDPPGGASTWAEATLARCSRAEDFAAGLSRWIDVSVILQQAGETFSIVGFVAAVVAFLASFGITVAVGSAALAVGIITGGFEALQAIFQTAPNFAQARAELDHEDTIDAVVCAIITSSTPAGAEAAIDSVLADLAPTAYPMVRALPLRLFMGHIFALETNEGFGGPCRECEVPDLTCSECLSNATCLPEISLVMSKLQGTCPNYSIESFEEVSRHHFRAVVSVTSSTSQCTVVRWNINPVGTVDMAGMRLTATVLSGSPPSFSVFGGPSLLDGSKDVVVCGPQVWHSCLTPLYDDLDTAWPLQISASFGTACTVQLDINILEAAND